MDVLELTDRILSVLSDLEEEKAKDLATYLHEKGLRAFEAGGCG